MNPINFRWPLFLSTEPSVEHMSDIGCGGGRPFVFHHGMLSRVGFTRAKWTLDLVGGETGRVTATGLVVVATELSSGQASTSISRQRHKAFCDSSAVFDKNTI